MAKQKYREREERAERLRRRHWHDDLSPETKKSVIALVFFAAAAITILAYAGKAGPVGDYIYRALGALLGKGYFIATLAFLLGGVSLLLSLKSRFYVSTLIGLFVFLVVSLGIIELIFENKTGGYIGFAASYPLKQIFDFWASMVILAALDVAALLIAFNIPLFSPGETEADDDDGNLEEETPAGQDQDAFSLAAALKQLATEARRAVQAKAEPIVATPAPFETAAVKRPEPEIALLKRPKFLYTRPPLELLNDDRGTPSSGDIKANANIIQRTLQNFGIPVEMSTVSVGPTITQYTLKPAEGIKLSRIAALQSDLAMALAAHPIRIEAPIPGKSLVGIEVPNRSVALVGLRSLIGNGQFGDSPAALLFALGRDVTGDAIYADLARMPHLLIAGATGSGKSVCMHGVVTSLLYRNPPEVLRFIMVDPKRVELSIYNGIPHLLTQVITDPKKTILALRWAVREMERRYELLAEQGARDILGFNAKMSAKKDGAEEEPLPFIVIIMDELADLMMAFPREVEGAIVRIAQMARAVGIHLILTTQRPSVEVITGLIKANITSRIAFQTGSQIDSRTILDTAGAEKLLGNGDMLFLAGDTAKPRRIQGSYVSDGEVKRVVEFLKNESGGPSYEHAVTEPKSERGEGTSLSGDDENDDEMYEEAKALIIESGKASASYLQRRLRVGYARAARLLDLLEENGIIGPGSGAKPREILVPTDRVVRDELNNDEI